MSAKLESMEKRLDDAIESVRVDAIKWVEDEARKILLKNPNLSEFVIAMGVYFFVDKKGEQVEVIERKYWYKDRGGGAWDEGWYDYTPTRFKSLSNFITTFDERLKLSGEGMIVRVNETIRDW